MDKVTHGDAGSQTEAELAPPASPKRPRTDYAAKDDRSGKSRFDFPKLPTFQRSISSPSAWGTPRESGEPMDGQIARAGSPGEDFVAAAERRPLPLGAGEPRPATAADEPGSHPGDDPEGGTPDDRGLASGDGEGGRRAPTDSGQIPAVARDAQSQEAARQPDCPLEDSRASVFKSSFPEVPGTHQRRDELEFCETASSEEEGKSPVPFSDYAEPNTLRCNAEEDPSRNSAEAGKKAETELEFQICGGNVSAGDSKTSSRVDGAQNAGPSAAERAERSVLASDAGAVRNAAAENVRFEVGYFCGAEGAGAAGGVIAEAQSEDADHATEAAAAAARIAQGPAEGDNEAGPFGVIDPAIWSRADGEAGGKKRGDPGRTAGVGSAPPVDAREVGAALPPGADEPRRLPRRGGRQVGAEVKAGGRGESPMPGVHRRNEHAAHVAQSSPGDGAGEHADADMGTLWNCDLDSDRRLVGNRDDLLAFASPSTSDAVVPCQRDLSHSRNAHVSDRFSPPAPAFPVCDRALGGFDTFEKIRLSPDEEEEGGNDIPVLASSTRQRSEAPQLKGIPEEEEEEEEESENLEHEFEPSDSACRELPDFTSAAEATEEPNCEPADESSDPVGGGVSPRPSAGPSSSAHGRPGFEVRRRFDAVLKELRLFLGVSRNDPAGGWSLPSPGRCGDVTRDSQGNASGCNKAHLSSPEVGRHRDASSDDVEEDRRLEACESEPAPSRSTVAGDGEQEVPLSSTPRRRERREARRNERTWSPSFGCRPRPEQPIHGPPVQPRRLEPLQTCARPIRVGLSKRAKTKHLHRPRPYK